MIKVLFVCLGNICRSPMAEAILQHMVDEAGLSSEILVDSAGTSSAHVGEPAHSGTQNILRQHDIAYKGRARQFARTDLNHYDYVLAMDESNLQRIQQYVSDEMNTDVRLFLSYANQAGTVSETEVPDPYYDNNFDTVYDLVKRGCEALLTHIRAEHDLEKTSDT